MEILENTLFSGELTADKAMVLELPAGFHSVHHLHQSVEILLCLEGSFRASVRGQKAAVHRGDYVVFFQNIPHSVLITGEDPCRMLQLHFHCREEAAGQTVRYFFTELELKHSPYLTGQCSPQLRGAMEGILAESRARDCRSREMIALYLYQILILLSRELQRSSSSWDGKCIHISTAVLYIRDHCTEKITVEAVAEHTGISTRYLGRLFQEQLGLSVSDYITDVRISRACDRMLVDPGYSLSQLALDLGFSSQQHFSRVFREKMGVPPGKYFRSLTGSR